MKNILRRHTPFHAESSIKIFSNYLVGLRLRNISSLNGVKEEEEEVENAEKCVFGFFVWLKWLRCGATTRVSDEQRRRRQ